MKILLVDDHTLFRSALRRLLQDCADVTGVSEVGDGVEAVRAVAADVPDLVIMDLRMPKGNGLEAIRRIRQMAPQVKILVLTVSDSDRDLTEAIRAGAKGYLLKNASPEEFRLALDAMRQGQAFVVPSMAARLIRELADLAGTARPTLTGRDRDVLRLVAEGASNAAIGQRLFLSENTVKCYLSRLMEKLGAENRVQLAVYAVRAGIADEAETHALADGSPLRTGE